MSKTTRTRKTRPARDLYQETTDRIIAALEAGTAPWRKTWASARAGGSHRSLSTGKAYRGINPLLLECACMDAGHELPLWSTFNQAKKLGGSVRKGEKGTLVVFWKWLKLADKETGEVKEIPMLRSFTVFNLDQLDLPEGARESLMVKYGITVAAANRPPLTLADGGAAILAPVAEYVTGLAGGLSYGGGRAFYRPSTDAVRMPPVESFETAPAYASVLYHELAHSTGHKTRQDRFSGLASFGDHEYSREELVAELSAAMLMARTGLACEATEGNSASYCASWIKALKADPRAVVVAAGKAQRAVDLMAPVREEIAVEVAA